MCMLYMRNWIVESDHPEQKDDDNSGDDGNENDDDCDENSDKNEEWNFENA